MYSINYEGYGCGIEFHYFEIFLRDSYNPNDLTKQILKRQGIPYVIEPVGTDSLNWYVYQWSTGETTPTIEIIYPGTYTCEIYAVCGTATRTFIVRDNVEITLATCDLESNRNMVIWQTTPEQTEYVCQVEVKRDGLVVGTVPYTDGQFIDNIGSDAASRTYTVTAIATDGTPCPLTSYTCQESLFDHGNIVVQGVEAAKDGETRLLSNRSWETVGLGEHEAATLSVYPNPSSGVFTVEGTGTLTVTNVLGQEIMSKEINGMETMELPQGIYFVKMGDEARKIVVE